MSSRRTPQAPETLQIEVPAQPRKRPKQERSVVLVDALKRTAWEILRKEGRNALSLERLSMRSGVAVSSIYEYFPTIESLVFVIFEDFRAQARQRLVIELRALPPSTTLYEGIALLLRVGIPMLHEWVQLDREGFVKASQYDELVRIDLVKPAQYWTSMATDALMERFPDEVAVRDRAKARFMAFHTILALPRAMALLQPAYLADADTQVLMARMLHALLTTPG
ncbi:TetR/AcrR family transcriptional regulator [Paraburkholderia silviterrae]|uniref:TetR/AcrR family transcriptional regulator n=1 Tax=Paraburkholderia silviterrae TaxID=2528715 RepID=A0A4R5M480_9BURK|nr:TetR/AcrR family transcriptional regulator [Paraburkholderia silviterrae]TDG20542.1 TetR/AcrR family transcriptional regulator [Paraburkholderia silviterrae]